MRVQLDLPTLQQAKAVKMPGDPFRIFKSFGIPRAEKGMTLLEDMDILREA
jgi:hypothetical protein